MKIPAGSLLPFAFVAVAAAWAIAKADGGTSAISQPDLNASPIVQAAANGVAANPTVVSTAAESTGAASQPPAGATTETATPPRSTPVAVSSPAPSRSTTIPQQPVPAATAYPAIPVAPSAADEIAATNTLHQLGKAYLQALIDNDPAPIAAMLASRCSGGDPSAILARRRAEVAAEAGVPIETLVAIAPVVAHLDLPGAEAHTVIQFDARGERHTLASADGWVLEGGAWRNAEC